MNEPQISEKDRCLQSIGTTISIGITYAIIAAIIYFFPSIKIFVCVILGLMLIPNVLSTVVGVLGLPVVMRSRFYHPLQIPLVITKIIVNGFGVAVFIAAFWWVE